MKYLKNEEISITGTIYYQLKTALTIAKKTWKTVRTELYVDVLRILIVSDILSRFRRFNFSSECRVMLIDLCSICLVLLKRTCFELLSTVHIVEMNS